MPRSHTLDLCLRMPRSRMCWHIVPAESGPRVRPLRLWYKPVLPLSRRTSCRLLLKCERQIKLDKKKDEKSAELYFVGIWKTIQVTSPAHVCKNPVKRFHLTAVTGTRSLVVTSSALMKVPVPQNSEVDTKQTKRYRETYLFRV
jgi:hypothetical protein